MNRFKQRIERLERVLCPHEVERPIIYISIVAPGQEHTPENTYLLMAGQLVRQSETDLSNIIMISEEDAML